MVRILPQALLNFVLSFLHLGLGLVFDASAEVEDPVHRSGHVSHLLIRVPCVFLRKDVESLCSEDPGLNPVSEGLLREAGSDHLQVCYSFLCVCHLITCMEVSDCLVCIIKYTLFSLTLSNSNV